MKSMKLLFPALLLSLSLGAFAQDDDELLDAAAEEESTEVFVPKNRWDKPIFHRVQLGFVGTFAKYTNNSAVHDPIVPYEESYFLKGVSLGWLADIVLTKNRNIPLYIELGGVLDWRTGTSDWVRELNHGSFEHDCKVNTLGLTIPVGLTYQFKDFLGKEGLTLSPLLGVYARFNLLAQRKQTRLDTETGEVVEETKSLMKIEDDGGWMQGRKHKGKLLQVGAQAGVNVFYKRYSFGLAYMYDIIPFAQHSSELGITKVPKSAGEGVDNQSGTGCDIEISTRHNFSVTFGYIF